jgi:hypothetical protein
MHRSGRWAKVFCVVGAVACLAVALMRPQWGQTEEEVPRRGRDLVILLDLSLSMLAEDVRPNRLEHAKSLGAQSGRGGTYRGRAPAGLFLARLAGADPVRVRMKGTMIGDAPLDGPITGGPITCAAVRAYIEQFPAPTLAPGDVVVLENLAAHRVAGDGQVIPAQHQPPPAALFARLELDRAALRLV